MEEKYKPIKIKMPKTLLKRKIKAKVAKDEWDPSKVVGVAETDKKPKPVKLPEATSEDEASASEYNTARANLQHIINQFKTQQAKGKVPNKRAYDVLRAARKRYMKARNSKGFKTFRRKKRNEEVNRRVEKAMKGS